MSSPLIRLGAVSAVLGGALMIVTHVVDPIAGSPAPETGVVGLGLALAYTAHLPLFAVAVVGLHLYQAERAGRFGVVATVVALVGMIAMAGPVWNGLFVDPVLRAEAPALAEQEFALTMTGGIVSLGLYALGLLLFAVATWRAAVLPRPAAALVAGGLVAAVPLEGLVPGVLLLYPAGLCWLGVATLQASSRQLDRVTV